MDVLSYQCWSKAESSRELCKYELSLCDHLAHPCSSLPYVFIELHFCLVSTASFSVPTLCAIFCLEPSFVFPPSLQCPDLFMTFLLIFTYPPACVPFCLKWASVSSYLNRLQWLLFVFCFSTFPHARLTLYLIPVSPPFPPLLHQSAPDLASLGPLPSPSASFVFPFL